MSRSSNPDSERALDAARNLLDRWAQQPVSRWLALAAGCGTDVDESETAERVLTAPVPAVGTSFDEWMVRDLADTAWQMAPRDIPQIPETTARRARHVVERMALAHLVRGAPSDEDVTAPSALTAPARS